MNHLKRIVAIAAIFFLVMGESVQPAHAGGVSGVASEWTQILNNVQLMEANTNWLQELEDDMQSLQQQLQIIQNTENTMVNTERTATSAVNVVPQMIFNPAMQDLMSLAHVVQTGQGLAYSMANLDQAFAQQYKGYGNAATRSYPQMYRGWMQTSLDTAHGAMNVVGLQGSQLQSDTQLLTQLQQQAQSTNGLLQALQVGNELAAEQATELQKLRVLIMSDISSKQAFQAQQISEGMASTDMNGTFFAAPNTTSTDTDGRTFNAVPAGYGNGSN